jgi:nucleosome binding factor SPN SPT16 subunit
MAEEGDDVIIDSALFYQRLERLQADWLLHKGTVWGGADALCVMFGVVGADDGLIYSKSSAFHLYMFGHELSNSLILITRNSFCFMGSAKKCSLFERDISGKNPAINVHLFQRTKDEGLNREYFHTMANICRKSGGNSIGSVYKDEYAGGFIKSWLDFLHQNTLQKIEISPAFGLFFAVKDPTELVIL